MLVTQAVEYFKINNASQIKSLIFPFLMNQLNFALNMIFFVKFSSNVKTTLVKNGKKVKVGYEYALLEDQKWKNV